MVHTLSCWSYLRDLLMDLRKPKHYLISPPHAKENKRSFMHLLGCKAPQVRDENLRAEIKWCPWRTWGNRCMALEGSQSHNAAERTHLRFFLPSTSNSKIRLEVRRDTWPGRSVKPREVPERWVISILGVSTRGRMKPWVVWALWWLDTREHPFYQWPWGVWKSKI